jgi:hypothetical protein
MVSAVRKVLFVLSSQCAAFSAGSEPATMPALAASTLTAEHGTRSNARATTAPRPDDLTAALPANGTTANIQATNDRTKRTLRTTLTTFRPRYG